MSISICYHLRTAGSSSSFTSLSPAPKTFPRHPLYRCSFRHSSPYPALFSTQTYCHLDLNLPDLFYLLVYLLSPPSRMPVLQAQGFLSILLAADTAVSRTGSGTEQKLKKKIVEKMNECPAHCICSILAVSLPSPSLPQVNGRIKSI